LLERDENFPEPGVLEGELAAIRGAVEKGRTGSEAAWATAEEMAVTAAGTEAVTAASTEEPTADATSYETPAPAASAPTPAARTGPARQRLALAQAALLSSLVA